MGASVVCDVCGNEVEAAATACTFCGADRQSSTPTGPQREYRVVNLEKNMPTVDQALKLLEQELKLAAMHGAKVLVLIHGYGSSGKGGAIKEAVRKQLRYLHDQGRINDLLPGEKCSSGSGHRKHLLQRFLALKEYCKRPNPGISIVVV